LGTERLKEKEKKRWKIEGACIENDRCSVFILCSYFRVEASVTRGDSNVCTNEKCASSSDAGRGGGVTEWTERVNGGVKMDG